MPSCVLNPAYGSRPTSAAVRSKARRRCCGRRGAEEAGAVFIKVSKLDGTAEVYGPAPQSTFEEARPADRAFIRCLKTEAATEADAEAYLARQIKFDPDIWMIEVEDRAGRNFLDTIVA